MELSAEGSKPEVIFRFRELPNDPKLADENCKRLIAAFDAGENGDYAAFWTVFDPDFVFYEADCLPYGGAHKGIAAAQQAMAMISQIFSKIHDVIETVTVGADLVMLYQTVTYEVKANKNSGVMQAVELFRFRSGKVIEWRVLYFDAHAVAQAIAGKK